MDGVSRRHPQTLWRLARLLLPLWFVVSVAMVVMITRWPLLQPLIDHAGGETQVRSNVAGGIGPLSEFQVVWSRTLRERLTHVVQIKPKKAKHDRGLHYTLLGTAVESGQSYAILRSDQGAIAIVKLGDQVDTFDLQSIEAQRIGLIRAGNVTYLNLPDEMNQLLSPQARTLKAEAKRLKEPPKFTESLQTISPPDSEMGPIKFSSTSKLPAVPVMKIEVRNIDSHRFISDTRLVPSQANHGRQVGFCIDSIETNSPILKLGLRPGDVIVRIDGKELAGLSDLERVYMSFDSGKVHLWDVRRGTKWLVVEIWPRQEKIYEAG